MPFFHKSATQRRVMNLIRSLKDENGWLTSEYDAMAKIAKMFF